jgi:LemA protein
MIKMALIVLLLVVAAILGLLVMLYNRLVALRQNVNQGSADIDVQLRQRHDLIPNLVSAVHTSAKRSMR